MKARLVDTHSTEVPSRDSGIRSNAGGADVCTDSLCVLAVCALGRVGNRVCGNHGADERRDERRADHAPRVVFALRLPRTPLPIVLR